MNTYFTVNESKHKASIDLYEKLASQNYLTVLVFSELLKHIIECQTFLTSNIFWIVRYRILFINYFSKYALKWLLLNYMFMLLNRQLFEKIFIDILENTYTEYIKIAFWTVKLIGLLDDVHVIHMFCVFWEGWGSDGVEVCIATKDNYTIVQRQFHAPVTHTCIFFFKIY